MDFQYYFSVETDKKLISEKFPIAFMQPVNVGGGKAILAIHA